MAPTVGDMEPMTGMILTHGQKYDVQYRTGLRQRLREAVVIYQSVNDEGAMILYSSDTGEMVLVHLGRVVCAQRVDDRTPTFLDRLVDEPEEL